MNDETKPDFKLVRGDDSNELRVQLLSAFRHLLRPLVRMLISNGVAYGELAEVAKSVYVEVASTDFSQPGKKRSGSRVAILTGLTRKEVKKHLDAANGLGPDSVPPASLNRATRVLQGWFGDSEYVGPYGIPLDLPLEGEGPSFAELVRRYSGDMPARAMLEELKGVRAVVELPDGLYRAVSRSFKMSTLDPDSARYFGGALHDLASTIAHNLHPERQDAARFERAMLREEFPLPLGVDFRAFLESEGQLFLEKLEDWVDREEQKADEQEEAGEQPQTIRLGVGVYLFQDDQNSEGHEK